VKYVQLDDNSKKVVKKKEEESEASKREYALLALNKKSNLFDQQLRTKVEDLNRKMKGNPVSRLLNVVNFWMSGIKKDEDEKGTDKKSK
jgi:hypothetical protein